MTKKWYEHFVTVEGDQAEEATPAPDPMTQVDPGSPRPAAAAPKSAADTIAELARAAVAQPPPKFEKAAAVAAKGPSAPMSMAEIYAAAELNTPQHGYTILKVADMLQSAHIRSLPAEVKRSSILVALEAAGVKIEEVVQDAILRDKALDAFERVQQNAVDQLEARKTEENRAIQAEIDRLVAEQKAKLQRNLDEVAAQREAVASWRIQKQQEEQKIADSVSYFVADNPITTGGRTASVSMPSGKQTPK